MRVLCAFLLVLGLHQLTDLLNVLVKLTLAYLHLMFGFIDMGMVILVLSVTD